MHFPQMLAVTEKRRWGNGSLFKNEGEEECTKGHEVRSGMQQVLQSLARLCAPLCALVLNNNQYPCTSPKCLLLLRKDDGEMFFFI